MGKSIGPADSLKRAQANTNELIRAASRRSDSMKTAEGLEVPLSLDRIVETRRSLLTKFERIKAVLRMQY